MRYAYVPAVLLSSTLGLAVSGCPAASAPGTPCTDDSGCPAGEHCDAADRVCTFVCRADVDCTELGGGPCSPRGRCEGTLADAGPGRDAPSTDVLRTDTPAIDGGTDCDVDGDGFVAVACRGNDCDDDDAQRFPGNIERCGGSVAPGVAAADHDEDCEPCTVAGPAPDADADADLYPSDTCTNPWLDDSAPVGCDPNTTVIDTDRRLVIGSDCDDTPSTGAGRHPSTPEVCNGVDEDCDDAIDEGATVALYRDADGDLHGARGVASEAVCAGTAGYSDVSDDCDDVDSTVFPSAPEECDGVDDDCDGAIDDGALMTFYRDADGDTVGVDTITMEGCSRPTGYVASFGDCDDTDATRYLGALEECDGSDDDCDGAIDDGALVTFYRDVDMDTYGDLMTSTEACTRPVGYVTDYADCNDTTAAASPSATESCDGIDNDCNGMDDENLGAVCTRGTGACQTTGYERCDRTCTAPAAGAPGSYLTTPAANGSWDWNCNGLVEPEYPVIGVWPGDFTAACSMLGATRCALTNMWWPTAGLSGPGCGMVLQRFSGCRWDATTSACVRISSSSACNCHQRCR